jgi:hypothetical protein
VQQLHDSVDRVRQMLVVMVHGRCSDQLATAARDAAQRLTSSRCALPLVQSRMIDGFKSLVSGLACMGRHDDRRPLESGRTAAMFWPLCSLTGHPCSSCRLP